MKSSNVLCNDGNQLGKIYLPFNAHFFLMVNCNEKITSYFDITYLKETELSYNNHKLSYSTSLKNDPNVIKKNLEEQSRNITTSKKEILNFDIGLLMTRKTCERLLSNLDDVEKIRYIVLISKLDVKSNNEKLPNYSYKSLKIIIWK